MFTEFALHNIASDPLEGGWLFKKMEFIYISAFCVFRFDVLVCILTGFTERKEDSPVRRGYGPIEKSISSKTVCVRPPVDCNFHRV